MTARDKLIHDAEHGVKHGPAMWELLITLSETECERMDGLADMTEDELTEHTLRDMAASLGVQKVKHEWDELALLVNAAHGNPGPDVWEQLLKLGQAIEDVYGVVFGNAHR